jgi:uncharacterized membrane protein YeaQ/YmgE (transglycosylase-associated protein family)
MLMMLWVVLGFFVGFLVSKKMSKLGQSHLVHSMLGIFGAVASGWLYCCVSLAPGVTDLNLFSLLIAITAATVLLILYEMLVHGDL